MGEITAEQAIKTIIDAKDMANMWKKISFADKGKQDNNITSILIPEAWPGINTIITPEMELEDPKKVQQWRTVNLPEEILHFLTVRNRLHL
eukprot:15352980-Ditylum_brightwellii.AAC.1